MILFTLKCAAGHEFEAWFRDGATYERQAARGLVTCPECGNTGIEKAPMAPRLGRAAADAPAPSPEQLRRMLQQVRRQVEQNCEYVGDRFAAEARRIHQGEAKARGIYGEATEAESRSLADDGIEVAHIPWVPPSDA
ncbi:MAG TPA: DUF1178 family protein [Stellaceae bacterium]|nr:DUF1178 family protein [Stellaceae bacterium]